MDREKHVCPDCGQTVDTVVRRHKTLGAWVPRWAAGPCHNPDCASFLEPGTAQHGHFEPADRHGHPKAPERADEPGTPAAPAS
ncbi:hypothetical protein ACF09K_03900 [Streptomyces sp. NPDC014882]|uniref:hypothetical protein n=1 Tax=Streptomyces sp. NPDC014882 TaxID=3364927 RepID=UPI0036FA1294